MALTKHLFHKGCTKPAMVLGMPLLGFVLLFMVWVLLAMYSMTYATAPLAFLWTVLFLAACAWLRAISKTDGFAFSQKLLRVRLRSRNVNRKFWGAVSYSPLKRQKK
jgi:Type IV secretory pathway, VirB3 components